GGLLLGGLGGIPDLLERPFASGLADDVGALLVLGGRRPPRVEEVGSGDDRGVAGGRDVGRRGLVERPPFVAAMLVEARPLPRRLLRRGLTGDLGPRVVQDEAR